MQIPPFTICIPTYNRPALLQQLLHDIYLQNCQPARVIVVDGNALSGQVLAMLTSDDYLRTCELVYIPSNHPNAGYQRYLGTLYQPPNDIILYLDDDLRIYDPQTLEMLLVPFTWTDKSIAGVTGNITFSNRPNVLEKPIARPLILKLLGNRVLPGGLTPTGHRVLPDNTGQEYSDVDWLRGGVMAFKLDSIQHNRYYPDIFAMCHIRSGLGVDDTFVSRWASQHGRLLFAFKAFFDHPDQDESKAYPAKAFGRAYAATYSRRFLNDHYRIANPPTLADRWALIKSYAGNTLLSWWRVVTKPSKLNLSLARGTTLGAFHGLTRPPTAKRLTPNIDWWADAEKALSHIEIIQNGDR